ncbi:acetyl-CoA carboxylase, carboxyltransferase subunit beta [Ammonifex thiophilus]|uniref:Acetyl-coenzyme A carboxylase carboxyl transferase subunit beta n=1 Tax=Ammonifex thiophilus TaxID=444093 RepID=A0A3D8P3C3_9THEO|nr:acetyl-CoA carboxylase, carboxyltransferase subunit beta [Ammonifex thiophilus]RDV82099.1 acetyl-CoA carboxylase carboxyltransferase subunit beta [Ammonifex thiophilus]
MPLFFKKTRYVTLRPEEKRELPEGLWVKCPQCGEILYHKDIAKNLKVCQKCNYHFRLTAQERLQFTLDEGSFKEFDRDLVANNPLAFPGYEEKLAAAREATGLMEAIVTGEGTIGGYPVVIGVLDSRFIMGSMGAAVGEKLARAAEAALAQRLPLLVFVASGGARMQEGVVSLMQMAKTAAALEALSQARVPYISVLTDPTTGGVAASFGMLGDVILAEPGALIGFTGPRVIEQTIRQKLPEGFQRAEFLLERGMLDMVVHRKQMRSVLVRLLRWYKS